MKIPDNKLVACALLLFTVLGNNTSATSFVLFNRDVSWGVVRKHRGRRRKSPTRKPPLSINRSALSRQGFKIHTESNHVTCFLGSSTVLDKDFLCVPILKVSVEKIF